MENNKMTAIIVMLLLMLGAYLVGWLISRFMSKGDSSTDGGDLSLEISEKEAQLAECKKNNATIQSKISAANMAANAPAPKVVVNNFVEPAVVAIPEIKVEVPVVNAIAEPIVVSVPEVITPIAEPIIVSVPEVITPIAEPIVVSVPEVITPVANIATEISAIEVNSAVVDNRKDDLKIVEGIGPKIEELLHNAGILTFVQLANTPVERVNEILEAAGPRYQMHNPTTWPQQSGLAASGEWTALKTLQDKLNKGKID